MTKLVKILLMLARLLGVVLLVLGFSIWFGIAKPAAVHAALGSLFVLIMWVLAVIALFALPKRGLPLFALLVGAVVIWFGVAQTTLLTGSMHWVVRFVHLLLGLSALGLTEALAKAVRVHKSQPADTA
jgi:hypothetical protein